MKKYAVLTVALIICMSGFSQTKSSFKNPQKHSAVKTPGFQFRYISGAAAQKQAFANTSGNFFVATDMQLPVIERNSLHSLRFAGGKLIYCERPNQKAASTVSNRERFYNFHSAARKASKLPDPRRDLQIVSDTIDALGITHIRAQQYLKGIKVYGGESNLHIKGSKEIFTGHILPVDTTLDVVPRINESSVLEAVTADLKTKTTVKSLTGEQKKILQYEKPEIALLIYENRLAYEVKIRPNFIQDWRYFVDAHSGKIIHAYNNTKTNGPATATAIDLNGVLRTINTYQNNGVYQLVNVAETMFNSARNEGVVITYDAKNTSSYNFNYSLITSADNTWNNPTSVSAHWATTLTYRYLKNTFNRNSLNNKGGNMIAFINVADDDGSSMENAYWNGQFVSLGNGGSTFKPLAGALDVIAHEFGHGVISNTANLEYQGQSGAINEAFADFFGSMVDRDDWLIGEDITSTSFSPSGALRNMADPHNGGKYGDPYWQPKTVSEMYTGSQDNGGVHINCGIINYTYYLFATEVTKEKAEQVFYRALTSYLTSRSQFIDLRIAIVQSAKDLYGETSDVVAAAEKAFDTVGIRGEAAVEPDQDYTVNPGEEFLLVYNTDYFDSNTLYTASITEGTNFRALSRTVMKSKPSVTDDGSYAIFVPSDSKIKIIDLQSSTPQESFISDEAFFDNVAISKDGNRLAAISTQIDTAIYVYDFIKAQWAKFRLYNPTTTDNGLSAGGVLYADALEFDHTGEYLMYDAYNEMKSTIDGSEISYWDIGFIKVWNNTDSTFADGNIRKLFSLLPENVSVGNPAFSKNSSNIIAFDYIDDSKSEYSILGADIVTGKISVIFENATVGYPSFSKNDDKIAFTALDNMNAEVVGIQNLADDKISPNGSAYLYVNEAKWPVFYSNGNRVLGMAPTANFTADIVSGTAPLTVKFLDASVNEPVAWQWTFEGGNPATSAVQHPVVLYQAEGTYSVTLKCSNAYGNDSITKTGYITIRNQGNEPVAGSVLITQVYGGGGNSGSPYKADFVDFFNTTDADVNISGWCLYYFDAAANVSTQKYEFPANTIIGTNKYFGLKGAEGTGTQPPWELVFDAVSTLDLSETTGKLVLLKRNKDFSLSATPEIGQIVNDPDFIDYVPFGMYATPVWGSAMSANISGFSSARRKIANGKNQNTQNTGNDFEIVTPVPRNANTTVGIKSSNVDSYNVYVYDNRLYVKGMQQDERVRIFTLTGNEVFNATVSTETISLDLLPVGVYIVKAGSETFRIILQ